MKNPTITTHMTFSLPIDLAEKLRIISDEKDVTISSLIRSSVKKQLFEGENEELSR